MAELSDTAPRVSDKGKAVDSPPDNSGQDALRDEAGLVKPETNLRDSTEVGNSAVLPTIEIDMGAEEVGSEVKIDAGPDTRAETRAESGPEVATETPAGAGDKVVQPEFITASVKALKEADSAEEILNVLQGKNAGERAAVLQGFEQENGVDFVSSLSKLDLSTQDRTAIMTALRRQDGVTDNSGAIERSLANIEANKGDAPDSDERKGSERIIRDTLSVLNTRELEELDRDMRDRTGKGLKETLLDNPLITDASRRAMELTIFGKDASGSEFRGSDYRAEHPEVFRDLIDNAVKNKDITLFQEAMRNAPVAERERFARGEEGGKSGDQVLQEAFEGQDLETARDFVANGGVSLRSLIEANDRQFLFWKHQDGIDVALKGARPEDRESYRRGEILAKGSPENLDDSQKRDLEFYNSVRERLKEAFPEPGTLEAKEDLLLNGGSFITKYAGAENPNERFRSIEDMSEADRQRLKSNPDLTEQLKESIRELTDGDETERALKLLDRKLEAETPQEAAKVGRSVEETLKDNPPPPFRHGEVLTAISRMSGEEAERYRTDSEFKEQLDKQLSDYFGEAGLNNPGSLNRIFTRPQEDLGKRMLEDIAGGKDPLANPLNKITLQALRATDGHNSRIMGSLRPVASPEDARGLYKGIEEALKADPALLEKVMKEPNSDEARDVRFALRVAFLAAKPGGSEYDFLQMNRNLMEKGELTLGDKLKLTQSQNERFDLVLTETTADEKAMLLNPDPDRQGRELQDTVFGDLNAEERKVMENALKNNEFSAADRVRLAVVGGNVSAERLESIFEGKDVATIKADYAKAYGTDMDTDVLEKVPDAERTEARDLLSSDRLTPGERVIRRNEEAAPLTGGLFFGSDGDVANIDATRNNTTRLLTRISSGEQNIDPKDVERSIDAMDSAIDQYGEDENKTREMLDKTIQTVIQAAVLASVVLSDGLTLPIALTLAGGAFHAGLAEKTDPWSVTKNLIIGGVDAGLMAIPAARIGTFLRIGDKAAVETASELATNPLIREGAEEQLSTGLRTLTERAVRSGEGAIPQAELTKLAQSVAREGATPDEIKALTLALERGYSGALNRGAADYFSSQAMLYEATKLGVGTGAVAGTVRGALEWSPDKSIGDNLTNVLGDTGTGALVGGGMTLAFGYGAGVLRGVLRKTPEGDLKFKSEDGPMEVVSTGRDGQEVVRVVNKGEEVSITGNERIRVRSANDDGDAGPAETVLPSLTIVGGQGRNVPPHANDNLPPAANDNRPPVLDERMVANGDFEPVITEAVPPVIPRTGPELVVDNGPTGIDRSRVTATNGDDSNAGPNRRTTLKLTGEAADRARARVATDRPPPTSKPSERPVVELPPAEFTVAQREALTRVLKNTSAEEKGSESYKRFLHNLAWFNQKSVADPKFDSGTYADLLILQARRGFGPRADDFVVPLEAMRNVDPATMRFVRDRFTQVEKNFKRPAGLDDARAQSTDPDVIKEEAGSAYEYAAQRLLMDMARNGTGPMKDWVFIPGTQGSPLDHAKIDGIFVGIGESNRGRVLPVDFKASPKAVSQADARNDWTLYLGRNRENRTPTAGDVAGNYNSDGTFNGIDMRTVAGNLNDLFEPRFLSGRTFDVNLFGPGRVEFPSSEPMSADDTIAALKKWVSETGRSGDNALAAFGSRAEQPYKHPDSFLNVRRQEELEIARRRQVQEQDAARERVFQDNYAKYKRELGEDGDDLTVDQARRMEEVRVILEQNDRTGFNAVDLYLIQSEINGSGISADAVLRHYSGQ